MNVAIGLALLLLAAALVLAGVRTAWLEHVRAERLSRAYHGRGCADCGYSFDGLRPRGPRFICPECGWVSWSFSDHQLAALGHRR